MAMESKHKRRRFDNQTIQYTLSPVIDDDISSEEGDASTQLSMYDNLLNALETRHGVPNYYSTSIKRVKTTDMAMESKHKRRRFDNQTIEYALPPVIDGDISSEEGDASTQLSMYDNLLKALETRHGVPNYYSMRHNNQGNTSDSNDACAESESASCSEEETGEIDNKYSLENDGDKSHLHDETMWERGSEETADENEISYQDDVSDFVTNGATLLDEITKMSSFNHHFGHVLANEVAEKLKKQRLKFKWKIPAKEMAMSLLSGTGKDLSMALNRDPFYGINRNLYNHWENLSVSSNSGDSCSSKRTFFFSLCNTYRDIMYCDKKPFYLKGKEDDSSIMDAYIMHALNHIHRIRDLVLENDAKLKKNESRCEELHSDIYLDHGFTRPKVLFLLPFASIAFRVVKRLVQLSPLSHKGNVAYMDRFYEEFGTGDFGEEDENNGSLEIQNCGKPIDFQTLFGGNNNDHFMMGIKFMKKSIKFYSNFYSSDIIVASPLGLVTKIGEAEAEKEKDIDYLSSIEVMIIDHADVITMQNFAHVNTVIEHLNRLPSKQHGTNMMRIKKWYLEGHATFYRQTILLGSYVTPDMNVLFGQFCFNYEGKVKMISKHKGVLNKVLLQVGQVYERFEASSAITDARLEYFSKKIFPKIKDSPEGGTLLFVSSYSEYVLLRRFLKSQDASFCSLDEYTKQSDISRSRLRFFEGKRKIMLYTERAHFYHRYKIRGIKNLIIYSLPERKEFYPEIVNMLEGSKNMLCSVLFSRFDHQRLERIVGTSSARRMRTSEKATFVFC